MPNKKTTNSRSQGMLISIIVMIIATSALVIGVMYNQIRNLEQKVHTAEDKSKKVALDSDTYKKLLQQTEQDMLNTRTQLKEKQAALEAQVEECEGLRQELEQLKTQAPPVSEPPSELKITLVEEIPFELGAIEPNEEAKNMLLEVAARLNQHPDQLISVEGHADGLYTHSPRYKSNWELSALRAAAVTRFLIDKGGLPPERFVISGWAEYRPLDTNESPEGRQNNRRVEIILYPEGYTRSLNYSETKPE